jgi:hypothetical protein
MVAAEVSIKTSEFMRTSLVYVPADLEKFAELFRTTPPDQ